MIYTEMSFKSIFGKIVRNEHDSSVVYENMYFLFLGKYFSGKVADRTTRSEIKLSKHYVITPTLLFHLYCGPLSSLYAATC